MHPVTILVVLTCLVMPAAGGKNDEYGGLCAPGCLPEMKGNGICNVECNNKECNDDDDDCDCKCGGKDLDNDKCDDKCNNVDCWWDYGRCLNLRWEPDFDACPKECDLEDELCDIACNIPECHHDAGACTPEPFCAPDCLPPMLGDGVCDKECNTDDCLDDDGDCTWPSAQECAPGCKYIFRSDGTCQFACNNAACNWDGGDCQSTGADECAPGCTNTMKTDGTCQAECFTQACGYDNGACDLPFNFSPQPGCAPFCGQWNLENGRCDPECNTIECGWDNGDCICGYSWCNVQNLGNDICNQECNNNSCLMDGDDCVVPQCAPGCLPANEGDGTCDGACNVAECEYDHGDCDVDGCTAACLVVYANGQCNSECNIPPCQFDGGDCPIPDEYVSYCDENRQCKSEMVNNGVCDSVCAEEENCTFDGDDCVPAIVYADACEEETVGQCKVDMRNNGICDDWCNNDLCGFDGDDCVTVEIKWCAPRCDDISGMNTDFVCQEACNVEECGFDNGMCDEDPFEDLYPESGVECATGCNFKWIGDGSCQEECNNALCLFDNFDCAEEENDTLGNNTDLTTALGFDLGVEDCPSDCKINWLGDSVCDPECATEECKWDLGDCEVDEKPTNRSCVLSEWVPVLTDDTKRQCNTGVGPLCGKGTSSRARQIIKPSIGDGIPCPPANELTQTIKCDLGECPEERAFCDRPNNFCPSPLPGPRLNGEFWPRNLGMFTEGSSYKWAQQTLNTPISSISVSSTTTTVFKMAGTPLMLPDGRSMVYGVTHFATQRALDGSDREYTIPAGYTLEFAFIGAESVALASIEFDDYTDSLAVEAYRQFAPKWPPPQPRMLDDGRVFALVPGGSMLLTTSFTTNHYTAVTVERYDLRSSAIVPLNSKVLWAETDVSEFSCSTGRLCFATLVQRRYAPRLIRVEFTGPTVVTVQSFELASDAADPMDPNPYDCRIATGPSVITLPDNTEKRVMIQACGRIVFYHPESMQPARDAKATLFDGYVSEARNELEEMSAEWYKFVDFRLYPMHLVHQSAYLSRSDNQIHYAIQGLGGVSLMRGKDVGEGFDIFADRTISSTFTAATALPSGACMLGAAGLECGLWNEEDPGDVSVQDRLTSSILRLCPDCATLPRFTSNPIATNYKEWGISLSDRAIKFFDLKDFSQGIQAAQLTDGLSVSGLLNSFSLPVGSKSLLPSVESALLPSEIEFITNGTYGVHVDYRKLAGHRLSSVVSTMNNVMYITAPYIVSEDSPDSTSSRKITESAMVSVSAGCRPGDYYNAQFATCTPCPPGAIAPSYNVMGSCLACPGGTVAVDGSRCTPCPRGQYQISDPETGAKECMSCPEGYECPYGAPAPLRLPNSEIDDSDEKPGKVRRRRASAPEDATPDELDDDGYGYYSASTETDFSTESNRPGEAAAFMNHAYIVVGGTAAVVAFVVIVLLKALPSWTAEKLVLIHILKPRRIEHTIEFDQTGKLFLQTLVKTSIRACFSILAVFVVAVAWLNLLAAYFFENVVITRTFVAASADDPGSIDFEGLSLDEWAPLTAVITFAFYVTPSSADTSTVDCVLTSNTDTDVQFVRPTNAPDDANWESGCYYDGAGSLLGSVQITGTWDTDRAGFDLELRACSILSASRVTFLANSPIEAEPTSYSAAINPPEDFVFTVDRSDQLKLTVQSQFHRSRFVSFGKYWGGITAASGYKVETGFTVDTAAVTQRADSVTDVSQHNAPTVEFVLLQNNLEYKTTVTRKTTLTALISQLSAIASTILIVMVMVLDSVERFWERRRGKEAEIVKRARTVMRRSLGIVDDPDPRCVRRATKRAPSDETFLKQLGDENMPRPLSRAAMLYDQSDRDLYKSDDSKIPGWLSKVPGLASDPLLRKNASKGSIDGGLRYAPSHDGVLNFYDGRRTSTSSNSSSEIGEGETPRNIPALKDDTYLQ
eukprot:Clim_evm86s142 gene=Clim_evmTU86s142